MILTDKNDTERTMKKSLFTKRKTVILFAIIAMFSWGCAFPFICRPYVPMYDRKPENIRS